MENKRASFVPDCPQKTVDARAFTNIKYRNGAVVYMYMPIDLRSHMQTQIIITHDVKWKTRYNEKPSC